MAGGLPQQISIHALREEGDWRQHYRKQLQLYFYPRPPRGGRQPDSAPITHPSKHFYPRPPRGGRRIINEETDRLRKISIHALREEGDAILANQNHIPYEISIHALREEGDGADQRHQRQHCISIHALREEGDQKTRIASGPRGRFLSTPSARRATVQRAPRDQNHPHFYPRPPRGGRLEVAPDNNPKNGISIHALREEGDVVDHSEIVSGALDFYPRPPRGGRPV